MPPTVAPTPAAPPLREIALMFSGGLDSTSCAVALAGAFDRVHLLTYRNGYGHYGHERVRRRVAELQQRVGPQFVYHEASSQALFEAVVVRSLREDHARYGSAFVWCMGCKLAMHAQSVLYCLEHGIPFMADGSNGETQEMVEQMLVSVSMVRFFYEAMGVGFVTPVYDRTRDEQRASLRARGLNLGLQVRGRHVGVQPSCLVGEMYYLPYLLFNKSPGHKEEVVAAFIAEKQRLLERHLADTFARRGERLEDRVQALRDRAAALGGVERVLGGLGAQQADLEARALACAREA